MTSKELDRLDTQALKSPDDACICQTRAIIALAVQTTRIANALEALVKSRN